MFEIGAFQVENLLVNNMHFIVFDLRVDRDQSVGPKSWWQRAEPVTESQSLEVVQQRVTEKDQPLILMCDNGSTSVRVAEQLVAIGYNNVFVIQGGFINLKRDWEIGLS